MTISELALNYWINSSFDDSRRKMDVDLATWLIEHMDPDNIEDIEGDLTPEAFMEAWNDIIEDETKTKTISYLGRDIELSTVFYNYRDDAQLHEGVFVHDTTDQFGDGDAVYVNDWTLNYINDSSDLESLFTSGDGVTCIEKNADGTYTVEI
jgi:hypothetical protein